jgi:sugar phosphate isomerase/epimerase
VATAGFRQPLKQAVQTAATLGARGVQFDVRDELKPADLTDSGRRQFLHQLSEMGLQTASLHIPFRRPLLDPENQDARLDLARSILQFAYQLRSNVVTARIGPIPPDPASAEYDMLRQIAQDLARAGNRLGATLAIIPTGDSPARLKAFLDTIVSEGPFGLDFDPAGFVMSGHDPAEALRTLHMHVIHFQARDGLRELDGGGLETSLGRGEVDWNEMIALVQEIDYRGWVVVNRTQGDDRLRDLATGVEYLRTITFQD